MSDYPKPYNPHDEDWTGDEPIRDLERDRPASVDPNGFGREEVEHVSRSCPQCSGHGLAPIFDFDYAGSAVIDGINDIGEPRPRVGRTVAYCTCLYGRWLQENHKKTAKDVHARIPDLADIIGRPSFWLHRDPTRRELTADETAALPQNFRELLARRMRVTKE